MICYFFPQHFILPLAVVIEYKYLANHEKYE